MRLPRFQCLARAMGCLIARPPDRCADVSRSSAFVCLTHARCHRPTLALHSCSGQHLDRRFHDVSRRNPYNQGLRCWSPSSSFRVLHSKHLQLLSATCKLTTIFIALQVIVWPLTRRSFLRFSGKLLRRGVLFPNPIFNQMMRHNISTFPASETPRF